MTTEISTFPDELLLLIFEHTVLDFRDPAATRLAGLIALTSINALWRTLIIEDAEFWTDVHVKVCNHSISHTNRPSSILPGDLARVQGFLDRSKELPIQLRIARTWALWDNMADEEAAERDWKVMFNLIMPHSRRCTSVNICCNPVDEGYLDEVQPPMLFESWGFPILRELYINGYYPSSDLYSYEDGTWGRNWKLSPDDTPLQALTFNNPTQYLPKALNVAWPSLSSLNLDVSRTWWPDVCDTLALVDNLQSLSIRLSPSDGPIPVSHASRQGKVEMPLLERIKTNNLMIWHHISTPKISSVTITHCGPYQVLDGIARAQVPQILVLLRPGGDRNSPQDEELRRSLAVLPLREVVLDDDNTLETTNPNVFFILGAFHNVKVVRFRRYHGLENMLRSLAEQREFRVGVGQAAEQASGSQNNGYILPKLEKVIIDKASSLKGAVSQIKSATDRLRAVSVEVEWLLNGQPVQEP